MDEKGLAIKPGTVTEGVNELLSSFKLHATRKQTSKYSYNCLDQEEDSGNRSH